jgi:hypothetical protein
MKRLIFVNRKMREYDVNEQNKYLGNKINSMKPSVKSSPTIKSKYNSNNNLIINNNLSNKKGK